MIPCWKCLNCRNGVPGLCLTRRAPAVKARRTVARYCACGVALYGKHRFCDDCRRRRNRETARLRMRKARKSGCYEKSPLGTAKTLGENEAFSGGLSFGTPKAAEGLVEARSA